MNLKEAKQVINFYETLSPSGKRFLEQIAFSERTNEATQTKVKRRHKRGYTSQRYDNEQIRYAWELLQKGTARDEVSRLTGIKKSSLMAGYLKKRLANMQNKITKDEKIATY